jgi:hypothetical protein
MVNCLNPMTNLQVGGPLFVGCLGLLIDYFVAIIHVLEAVSSTRNLRTPMPWWQGTHLLLGKKFGDIKASAVISVVLC